jgi:hypothetical protein
MVYDRDGTPLGRWGEPTPDGERCRQVDGTQRDAQGHPLVRERRIGQDFYTDAQRSRVCDDAELRSCIMQAPPGGSLQLGAAARTAEAFLGGVQGRIEERAADAERSVRTIGRVARDVATGRVRVGTLAQAAADRVTHLVGQGAEYARHPEKLLPVIDKARAEVKKEWEEWKDQPLQEKAESVASAAGSVAVDLGTRALTGTLNQAAGVAGKARKMEKAGEAAAGAAKKGQQAARAGHTAREVAEHPRPAVVPSATADQQIPGRHGAFRQAKRDAGIPQNQHPERIERPELWDGQTKKKVLDSQGRPVKTREFVYTRPSDGRKITIQDHSARHQYGEGGRGDQGPHFNVRPYGESHTTLPGAQEHYPFKK